MFKIKVCIYSTPPNEMFLRGNDQNYLDSKLHFKSVFYMDCSTPYNVQNFHPLVLPTSCIQLFSIHLFFVYWKPFITTW